MGRALGTGAVMTALRRTEACGYTIGECVTLDKLRELSEEGKLGSVIRSVESLFSDEEELTVSDSQAKRFQNGGALALDRTALRSRTDCDGQRFRVKKRDGYFIGLGKADAKQNLLKIVKTFIN